MRTLAYLPMLLALLPIQLAQIAHATDNGIPIDPSQYANRATLRDFTGADCPDMPRGLEQVRSNLCRHSLAVHSGLVLITKEGALVIDPARPAPPAGYATRSGSASSRLR